MIRRRATVGLSLLSALLFCAFAAQSAWAVAAKNITAVTCVEEAEGGFSDAHCDIKSGSGKFGHKAIANGTKTGVDVSNEKVTNTTKNSEPAVFKGKAKIFNVTVECTIVKNKTALSNLENSENKKEHLLQGVSVTEFSNCSVKQLMECTVTEPIVAEASFEAVEQLNGPKGEEAAMGLEFEGAGAEETFATIEYKGAMCPVEGEKVPVKGSLFATSGPTTETEQNSKESGATLIFTPKFGMEKLKAEGETAELTAIVTPTMSGGGQPITSTTVT